MKNKLNFVIVTPSVRTNVRLNIKSVVGGMGRFDVLSRCFLNLFRWSERLPFSINFIIYFSHPKEQKILEIGVSELLKDFKFSITNELESTLLLQKIFFDPHRYYAVFRSDSFVSLIDLLSRSSSLLYLTPQGLSLSQLPVLINCHESISVVLGSQTDLSFEEEKILHRSGAIQISLGTLHYLASHCITILCQEISRLCASSVIC
ncbi:MAG: hypothetical protein ACTSYD_09490 [Candidatus Heimdallarchaeaceae archaeon]